MDPKQQMLDNLELSLGAWERTVDESKARYEAWMAANEARRKDTKDPLLLQLLEKDLQYINERKAKLQADRDKLVALRELLIECRNGTVTMEKVEETKALLQLSELNLGV